VTADGKPFLFPLPGMSLREGKVLRQLVAWADDYLRQKAEATNPHSQPRMPTTLTCSKHFRLEHKDMLALLNSLESQGMIVKNRQLSGGLTGYGYDGSLHSSVMPTAAARALVFQYSTQQM